MPQTRRCVLLLSLFSVIALPLTALETRTLTRAFPLSAGETLRLANLAGAVEILSGSGDEISVTATIHAEGDSARETQQLLEGMAWIETRDRHGLRQWALSYPVDDYRGFHYPGRDRSGDPGFWVRLLGGGSRTTVRYLEEKVVITRYKSGSTPTLYADLEIRFPRNADLALRQAVGGVTGRDLEGDLTVDTASGDVEIDSFRGALDVDTGSGDIFVAALSGSALFDTGSGDIQVRGLEVTSLDADTGSGDILVENGRADSFTADTGSGEIRALNLEVVNFEADTGSGDVLLQSSLRETRRVLADTGSGDVRILAGPDASFDARADLGSGDFVVRYADASLRHSHGELVAARRGDGRTRIDIDTGSGDCVIAPQ